MSKVILSRSKDRLKASLQFWKCIGASQFVLDFTEHGYKLPFLQTPPKAELRNDKSALSYLQFVTEAINDLRQKELVVEFPSALMQCQSRALAKRD